MATYNTAFGSLPGYNELLGTTNTTGGGQQQVYGQRAQRQRLDQAAPAPQQTFAQLQKQGLARPAAPAAPTAQPFAQHTGSEQGKQMRERLQQQLQQFGQAPSRYDTQAFQQIRGAQAANLQAEYGAQQKALNEELARRGLSASSIGGGRMGDLAGQQARALASLDAQLLQQAADTQAADRAQLLQSGQGLAELAGSQDLAQFEANRVAQAATFENQLRAAQFGQQQYESAGQQAMQAAQAEEAAQQAARQFDLAATGQSAQLSLDLQRLLGQQEIEQAQLTGTLGGQQTLAGQQMAEQRRQFDIEQALKQQLGTGGLDIQRGQLTLDQQRLAFQQQDAQAERALREAMQTRELSAQEKQQLADIAARKDLQTQQITEQARQFGLTLNDQQAARIYQGGFTTQELALKRTQIDNELALQNRQLDETERNNLALNAIERDRVANQASQFGQQLGIQQGTLTGTFGGKLTQDALQNAYQRAAQLSQITGQQYTVNETTGAIVPVSGEAGATLQARLQQAGITGTFGGALTQEALQNAYTRAAQLSQITGKQYTVNPLTGALTEGTGETLQSRLQQAELTGTLGGQSTLAKLQQNLAQAQTLSQITGKQYTVDANGNLVEAGAATESARQFNLENTLRQALGMSEATGYVYDPITGQMTAPKTETVQGQIARSQTLMALAQSLGNLTPEQISTLLGRGTTTSGGGTGSGGTSGGGSTGGSTFLPDDATTYNGQPIPEGFAPPDSATAGDYFRASGVLIRYDGTKWVTKTGAAWSPTNSGTNTSTTSGTTTTTASATTTTKAATTTTVGTTTTVAGTTTTLAGTTTTASGTTTTVAATTTTVAPTTTTAAPTTTTLSTNMTAAPSYWNLTGQTAYFDGQYRNTQYGWAIYKGGNWYVAPSAPTYTSTQTPTGQYTVSAYPGYTILDGGKTYSWNGSQWIAV